ncbi:MAG: NosD domain-containing protein [Myxococcota bacterium]|nr:NosD domain-containing protein [Myxococcota bacterium]
MVLTEPPLGRSNVQRTLPCWKDVSELKTGESSINRHPIAIVATMMFSLGLSGACHSETPTLPSQLRVLRSACGSTEPPRRCVKRVRKHDGAVNNGTSWSSAFTDISDAIHNAKKEIDVKNGVDHCEVWVSAGTYYIFSTRRSDTLRMAPHVYLYGGFNGTEKTRGKRNPKVHLTTLDGRDGPAGADRVYHVVTGASHAVLDGFVIANGEARGARHGGGMYNDQVSPTVRNCVFQDNSAGWSGGAIFNNRNRPLVTGSRFLNNRAKYGGAIANRATRDTLCGNTFMQNKAHKRGGAIYNDSDASGTVGNSYFWRNSADKEGGAIYNKTSSEPAFFHCTFVDNFTKRKKKSGGAIYSKKGANPSVANCLFWRNRPRPISGNADVRYSILDVPTKGEGNRTDDPLLTIDRAGAMTLNATSPCIDAANGPLALELDITGHKRVVHPKAQDKSGCNPIFNLGNTCIPHADIGALEYRGKAQ